MRYLYFVGESRACVMTAFDVENDAYDGFARLVGDFMRVSIADKRNIVAAAYYLVSYRDPALKVGVLVERIGKRAVCIG